MKEFEYFIKIGEVRRVSIDKDLAKSLIIDMEERIKASFLLDINVFAKMIFENIYDALRDFCDALLYLKGYKSYSHEASIVYLLKEGFDIAFVSELNNFKLKRNDSKYRGSIIGLEDARSIKDFYQKNKTKIYKKLEEKELI